MPYKLGNRRPSVLHIPDAGLRLEPGGTTTVPTLTPQLQGLLAMQAVEIVTDEPVSKPAPAPARVPMVRKGSKTAPAVVKEPADDAG